MFAKTSLLLTLLLAGLILFACGDGKEGNMQFTGAKDEVKLMTVDPGHFHAALVQKKMYKQIDSVVYVYAPKGPDVQDHLNRIENFNTREENPTDWETKVYTGEDFLQKMVQEKPGNLMVTAGNNQRKTEYIKTAVDAGVNVLADKPMCINQEGFELLKAAFKSAEENNVLLYDIMTERYEITTMLQRELANTPALFGDLIDGTPDKPAVTKESVHHFFKYVSGNPIKRPVWYFDTTQQGEGIVDVSTHLVDLIQWECFPNEIIDYETDIEMHSAKRYPTLLTLAQFSKVTGADAFPEFLQDNIRESDKQLEVYANGEFVYQLKGKYAKVSVIWNFEAPEGAGDTHYSIMRGTNANVIIEQGAEQNYKPELYIEPVGEDKDFELQLIEALETIAIENDWADLGIVKIGERYQVEIPAKYRVGHEAHFAQVTEKYLGFLVDGMLPEWEVPNMIAKYYTNIKALEMARE